MKQGVMQIPELEPFGDSLFVIAFGSKDLNIYKVLDAMTGRGWSLNGLHKPACAHLCVTLLHAAPGVADRFIDDLTAAVAFVKDTPEWQGEMAPVYGMANTVPNRGVVADAMKEYMDGWYRTASRRSAGPPKRD